MINFTFLEKGSGISFSTLLCEVKKKNISHVISGPAERVFMWCGINPRSGF